MSCDFRWQSEDMSHLWDQCLCVVKKTRDVGEERYLYGSLVSARMPWSDEERGRAGRWPEFDLLKPLRDRDRETTCRVLPDIQFCLGNRTHSGPPNSINPCQPYLPFQPCRSLSESFLRGRAFLTPPLVGTGPNLNHHS